MKKYNVLVAAVSILFGLAIFWFSRGLSTMSSDGVPGEAFWPHMIAWLLIGLGILQLIEVFAFPAINAGREVILGAPGNLWAYLTAAVAFGFATLMAWAGFVIAGVIMMPIIMVIMGERHPCEYRCYNRRRHRHHLVLLRSHLQHFAAGPDISVIAREGTKIMYDIIQAAGIVFSYQALLILFMGTLAGILIGSLPGLTVNMGIALLMPMTFSFQGLEGILMLLGVYCGAIYGGSISAILINTPGTPASAATVLDGYPMTLKGEAGRALGLSTASSMFGGLFSTIALIIIAPQLAKVATGLSAPDYFALGVFGYPSSPRFPPNRLSKA